MQSLPKIVVKRLNAQRAGDVHPDADLLTAFAERRLPKVEQVQVTEHLSHCFECREIVALALPEIEAVQPRLGLPSTRAHWIPWPVVRATFAGAGVLALALFGVVQYREHASHEQILVSKLDGQNNLSATQREAGTTATQNALISAPASSQSGAAALSEKPAGELASHGEGADHHSAGGVGLGSGQFGDGHVRGAPRAHGAEQSLPSVPPQKSSNSGSLSVELSSQNPAVPHLSARNEAPDQLIENTQIASATNEDVVKAKAAGAPAASGVAAIAPPVASLQTAPSMMRRAFPLWTVTSAGTLRRSFDAGKTWEEIDPVNGAASSIAAKKMSANDSNATAVQAKDSDQQADSQARLRFRAVAAIGPEVWAGAARATLYHSSDSGNQWQQVWFSAAASPKGDVTSIEFVDPQHGSFATSAGERWVTADNGQSWQKQ